jgi:hypothetical protein
MLNRKIAIIGVKVALVLGSVLSVAPVLAYDVGGGIDAANSGGQTQRPLFACDPAATNCKPIIPEIVSILMYIVGIIAVIMLIVGGIMYAISSGDEAKIKKAKATITAALIGLAFAILAWTLVNFVFTAIK